jgi:hypothetical protein
VHEIAVLRVLQAEEGAVRGERAAVEATTFCAAELHGLGRAVDLARCASGERDVDREAVAVADPGGDNSRRLREALAPAVWHPFQERLRLAFVEGLDEPAARLVAGLVLEPEHTFAVERRRSVGQADRVVGDLAAFARSQVPGVYLPDAGLVRRVDDAVGRGRRPLGERRLGRAEALLPGLWCACVAHRARG